ncbi:MAG: hypothetical protein ACOYOE_02250 [Chlorobium sp.]
MSEKELLIVSLFKTGELLSKRAIQEQNFVKNLFLSHQGRGFFVVLSPVHFY